MRVIIFGAGNYYQEQKGKLGDFPDVEIVAITDNNHDLWNQKVGNIRVIAPGEIRLQHYDYILIMSLYVCEIYRQLIELGVSKDRIVEWKRFLSRQYHDSVKWCFPRQKILIITQELKYDGGSLAAIYAAKALREHGMTAVIATPDGDGKLIEEVLQQEISVIICPMIPYISDNEKRWICQFDAVIVNLLTMVESACELYRFCPVFLWLHEVSLVYEPVMKSSIRFAHWESYKDLPIYAVSDMAGRIFHRYLGQSVKDCLTLGIPDREAVSQSTTGRKNKIVFAVIGVVCDRKAQDIFVRAAANVCGKGETEFWIIGQLLKDDYCKSIAEWAANVMCIRFMGEMTRKELEKAFADIDVVVCVSREETLSMVIIEGMMQGKVCITTDNTGISEYICDGQNGFVVPANNVWALRDKMEWVIANQDAINRIGVAARKTYEENFTMDVFGERLERAVKRTIAERNTQKTAG